MNFQKIKIILFGFAFIIISMLMVECASKLNNNTKLNIDVQVLSYNAWINLMPGINMRPTFHFTGKIIIENNSADLVKYLKLQEIDIYSDSILIYKFAPIFKSEINDTLNNILPSSEKVFTFMSPKELLMKNGFDPQKHFSALLKFSSEGNIFEYKINNIKVDKVY